MVAQASVYKKETSLQPLDIEGSASEEVNC